MKQPHSSETSGHGGVGSRLAGLLHRSRPRRAAQSTELDVPVTHEAPDAAEWDESLIGIEPNSGEVDPPAIC